MVVIKVGISLTSGCQQLLVQGEGMCFWEGRGSL